MARSSSASDIGEAPYTISRNDEKSQLGDPGVIDKQLDHSWYQKCVANVEALDRLRDRVRRERLNDRAGARIQQHAIHGGAVCKMEHWRRMKVHRIARETALGKEQECARMSNCRGST